MINYASYVFIHKLWSAEFSPHISLMTLMGNTLFFFPSH